jgi:hypothetical protein
MGNTIIAAAEPVITLKQMQRIVTDVVIDRRKVAMFRGPFGIGKTFGVRAAAAARGAFVVEIRLGQYDSVDMRGMPELDRTTRRTVWFAPDTLPFEGNDKFPDDVPILLFFDEITSATPAVFAVCYQLMQDFAIGEHKLKSNVRICGAGNNDNDRGVVNRIPMPLNNRMRHYQIAVDRDGWCYYMMDRGAPMEAIAYHKWKKDSLNKWNPEDAEPSPCQPTPRSWEDAIETYKEFGHTDPDFCAINMAAAIGEGETTEFLAFTKIWSKVLTVYQIVKAPTKVPLPEEESLTYATAVSVAGQMNLTNVKPLHTFLTRLAPEYVVMAWQLALARKDERGQNVGEQLYMSDEFLDIGERYKAIFDVASRGRKAA